MAVLQLKDQETQSAVGRRFVFGAVLAGALAVALGLVALLGYGLATSRERGEAQDEARPQGKLAPQFEMPLYQGAEFLGSDRLVMAHQLGHPVVVNFWFPSCPPCRIEMPDLERAWQRYQSRGVIMIGVTSLATDTEQDVRQFLKEFDITYPVGPDTTGEIVVDFGVTLFPSTYFITADQVIARKRLGILSYEELEGYIEELLP